MNEQKKFKIPFRLIVLDAVGAILLGLGVAELFANTNLVPGFLRVENYALFMIIFGVAMMLPMVTYIMSTPGSRKSRQI